MLDNHKQIICLEQISISMLVWAVKTDVIMFSYSFDDRLQHNGQLEK